MLPKGNVSKRHARLVFRDGRYIVTDLNSTNGTYVNRRRINQATIVRQGDRIYIGDFVLRIESPEESSGLASSPASAAPIPLRDTLGTSPDQSSRPKAPPMPPPLASYPPVPPAPRVPLGATAPEKTPSLVPSSAPRGESPSVIERPISGRDDSIDTEVTAYRGAVAALTARVEQRLEPKALDGDLGDVLLQRVDASIVEQLADLRREDIVGAAIVEERLRRDARAELLELGA